jgi:tRNA (cmo5U34)-methyltransferase
MGTSDDYQAGPLAASFDSAAPTYDASRAQLVPCFGQFYGSAVGLLDFPPDSAPRILDLGAGTGLLSAWVLGRFPQARLTLVDLAGAMLEKAGQRLAAAHHPPTLRAADYSEAPLGGPYEAVVSALSIHHLDDARKRRLFAATRQALAEGGLFVNAEQVAGPTERLERMYVEAWLADARQAGASPQALEGARERMALDRHVPVETQMQWLREAGFREVDLWFKQGRFAVYWGRK